MKWRWSAKSFGSRHDFVLSPRVMHAFLFQSSQFFSPYDSVIYSASLFIFLQISTERVWRSSTPVSHCCFRAINNVIGVSLIIPPFFVSFIAENDTVEKKIPIPTNHVFHFPPNGDPWSICFRKSFWELRFIQPINRSIIRQHSKSIRVLPLLFGLSISVRTTNHRNI